MITTKEQLCREAQRLTPNDVCAELLACSVVEYSYAPEVLIAVELDRRAGKISDTGRGMQLKPDLGDALSHAERALTDVYPCIPSNSQLENSSSRTHLG